jgi:hypothetical protein
MSPVTHAAAEPRRRSHIGLAISRRRQTAAAPAVGRDGSDFSRMAPLERDIDATNS